jgi:hypothetical protein
MTTTTEKQNILLTLTKADGTIRSQGFYWTDKEAMSAAQRAGGFFTIRNVETGKLIAAEW